MQCINHADRPAELACMKDDTGFCEECLQCRNPGRYCEFRTGCEIWFLTRDREKASTEK